MLLPIALILSSLASITLLLRIIWALRTYKYEPLRSDDTPLPSVTVAVAARNEVHALAQCLETILRSDYQKLEVLVLDDSSNDDTSLIIKSFANAGVRFIAGDSLPNGWLGKNNAYKTLLENASGEYIMFLDVDTIIESTTIRQLMDGIMKIDVSMISVLPRREDSFRLSALFGTYRYLWELILSSRSRPPSASAVWLAEVGELKQAAGFAPYKQSVRIEQNLAATFAANRKYAYVIGTKKLGISFAKRWTSQCETAVRLYYPAVGASLTYVLGCILFAALLILPIIVTLSSQSFILWSSAIVMCSTLAFGSYTYRTHGPTAVLLRIALWPLILIQDVVLTMRSFISYASNTVHWKGRLVQAPAIHSDSITIDE